MAGRSRFVAVLAALAMTGIGASSSQAGQSWRDSKPRIRALTPAFMCIHRYEGAWNAHTGNGYYGGLQMDMSFMQAYGREYLRRWGTADHWPPRVQILVGVRAHDSGRGFYPWPTTARYCGLI